MTRDWPGVSVIMPVLNEERHLEAAISGLFAQNYPGPFEIVLAIGPCQDRTLEIAQQLATDDSRLVVVDSPTGKTPASLNLAVAATRYDLIVRMDGHGVPGPRYIETAVETLVATGAANVGGIMDAQGGTPFEQAVAAAYNSPLGLGSSTFHLADSPAGASDSVFLGSFRKDALLAVGGFDETMFRAQDWELNLRLRQAGEIVWFTPEMRVTYRPRSTVRALAHQFFMTGKWRREVVRRYPETASARYLAPGAMVAGVTGGVLAGVVGLGSQRHLLLLGFLAPMLYGLFVLGGTIFAFKDLPLSVRARMPLVLTVMHTCWGLGFLIGLRADENPRFGSEV